jgi:membrane fusion protein (multidrug efflux system)
MEESEKAETPARPRRRPSRRLIAGAGIAAAAILFLAWRHYAVRESTDDAQIDGHLTPVAARVEGAVVAVLVKDNQRVEAGTLLVKIDPRGYEVALERAKADLAEAQAAAEAAHTGVPLTTVTTSSAIQTAESERSGAEARLRSAQARLREAAARDTKAAQDLARLVHLIEKDEVSRQEYDSAAVAAESGRSAREAAEAEVKEAEEGVQAAEARLAETRTAPQQRAIARARASSAEAKVAQCRASVAQAELDLEHTRVLAPAAGVVSRKTVEVGQVVQTGQPLMALVSLDDVWVTANFKESQLRNLRAGQPVTIRVDAYGGRGWRGHVDSLAPATGSRFSLLPPENATGNYVKVVQRVPVKIVLERGQDPDHMLRPGMSVVPTVLTR